MKPINSSKYSAPSLTDSTPQPTPSVADDADISARKHALRQRIQRHRIRLKSATKLEKDAAIIDHLSHYLQVHQLRRIAGYAPLPTEPGGDLFVPSLANATTQLWLPAATAPGVLRWGRYTGPDSLTVGAYGITQPIDATTTSVLLAELDAVIVPAMAIDAHGIRLGKGGGYYDRALAHCAVVTIGVVYAEEVLTVPHHDHDIACDVIISDAGTITPTR